MGGCAGSKHAKLEEEEKLQEAGEANGETPKKSPKKKGKKDKHGETAAEKREREIAEDAESLSIPSISDASEDEEKEAHEKEEALVKQRSTDSAAAPPASDTANSKKSHKDQKSSKKVKAIAKETLSKAEELIKYAIDSDVFKVSGEILDKALEAGEQVPWVGVMLTLLKGFYSGVAAAKSELREKAEKLGNEIKILLESAILTIHSRAEEEQEAPDFLNELQKLLERAIDIAHKHAKHEKGKKGRVKFIKNIILGPKEIEKMDELREEIHELLNLQGFVDQQKMVRQLGSVQSKLDELIAMHGSPLKGSPKEKFHKTNFNAELEKGVYPGTRSGTLQKIDSWLNAKEKKGEEPRQRIMVLCAEKYQGKTMLAAELCRKYSATHQLAAYYFFRFGAQQDNQLKLFLFHLGMVFCENIDGYAELLADVSDAVFDNTEDICRVICNPLKEMKEPSKRMLLVVDALDQASGKCQPELIEFLASFTQNMPSWMNLFVTTRPAEHIVDNLNRSSQENGVIFLEFPVEETEADLKTYVTGTLKEKKMGNINEIQDEVFKKADGSFIYAHYAVKEILDNNVGASTESLNKLPKTLDDFHHSQFSKLKTEMGDQKQFYGKILGVMLAAYEPLDGSLVLRLVGSNDRSILDLISHNLIQKKGGRLMFYHHAAPEWLMQQGLDGLGGDIEDGHRRLSEWCCECLTSILAFKDSKEPEENETYALRYAVYHYLESKEFGKLKRMMCDFGFIWLRLTVDQDRNKNMMQLVNGYEKVLNCNVPDGMLDLQKYLNFILENAQALVYFPAHVLQYAANSHDPDLAREAKAKLDDLSVISAFKEWPWFRIVLEPSMNDLAQVCRHFIDQVWALDLSADSSKAVLLTCTMSASADISVGCRLHVLDCRTGVDVCRPIDLDGQLRVPCTRTSYLQSHAQCVFLPGDELIFFGSLSKVADCNGHLQDFDLETESQYISFSCAVHHEKKHLALGLMDSTNPVDCVVRVYDLGTKTMLSNIATDHGPLTCANFSSRGDRLLLHDRSNNVYLLEDDEIKELSTVTGKIVHTMFNKHDSVVILSSVDCTPALAQYDGADEKSSSIYEWSMKAPVSFNVHSHRMYVLHGNPDPSISTSFRVSHFDLTKQELSGSSLLTVNSGPCPTFIDNTTGIEIRGDRLAHRIANTVSIYSLAKLHAEASRSNIDVEAELALQAPNIVHRLSFLTPGDVVVQRIDGGVGKMSVDFVEVGSGQVNHGFKKNIGQINSSLVYSIAPVSTDNGKHLLVDGGRDVGKAGLVFLWNHATKEVKRLEDAPTQSYVVTDMSFGPHENQVLIGGTENSKAIIDIFDATTGKWAKRHEDRGSYFLPCSKTGFVASCTNDGKAFVWDEDGKIADETTLFEDGCLNRDELVAPVTISSDREKAIILQVDYEKVKFLLFNARTCKVQKVLEEAEAADYFIHPYPHLAAFSPDDTVVATAIMTAFVRIYDVFDRPGELLKIIGHGNQPITCGVWCSHKSLALITERKNDAILRVWDCQTGKEVNYYPLKETVSNVLASPTRKELVVGLKTSGVMILHQENLNMSYIKTVNLLQ